MKKEEAKNDLVVNIKTIIFNSVISIAYIFVHIIYTCSSSVNSVGRKKNYLK